MVVIGWDRQQGSLGVHAEYSKAAEFVSASDTVAAYFTNIEYESHDLAKCKIC